MASIGQHNERKRITILGASGTIGQNTLDLIGRNPEKFDVIALTGNNNIERLSQQARAVNANYVAVADPAKYQSLKSALAGTDINCGAGPSAIIEAATMPVDISMAAIVGVAGLAPTLAAMQAAPTIALANKECLVTAGALFMREAKTRHVKVIPVDSEHSAAYQCLLAENPDNIAKLTLTASGGPFYRHSREELSAVTKAQALKHPNWEMGQKITIDSATLMNKGLELIEAKYLFDLQPEQIDMLIHPQSIIHCLVSFKDGAVLAQMSQPDMRVPIAYSLAWPERMSTPIEPVDLTELGTMTFEKGDRVRFPCLALAEKTLYNTEQLGPVLNAANEIAVEAFLKDQIPFMAIPGLIEEVMSKMQPDAAAYNHLDLNDVLDFDEKVRKVALELRNYPLQSTA